MLMLTHLNRSDLVTKCRDKLYDSLIDSSKQNNDMKYDFIIET